LSIIEDVDLDRHRTKAAISHHSHHHASIILCSSITSSFSIRSLVVDILEAFGVHKIFWLNFFDRTNKDARMKFTGITLALLLAISRREHADAFGVSNLPFSAKTSKLSITQLNAEGSKITMPALSSTMKEGRVVSWLKQEGDAIEAGDAIMVVESDKADMDVEAFEDGFLAKIIVGEGEMAPVGEPVALIASEESEIDEVIASFSGAGSAPAPAAAAPAAAAAAPPAASSGKKQPLLASSYSVREVWHLTLEPFLSDICDSP